MVKFGLTESLVGKGKKGMNIRRVPIAICCFAVLAPLAIPLCAESAASEAEARRLLDSATIFGDSPCIVARLEMRISGGGPEKTREIELSIDRKPGRTLTLARIVNPAFLSDMKFLKRIEAGMSDGQWVKTSRGVRRLGEGNRFEQIFGSDFTAEDFGTIESSGFDIFRDPARDTAKETVVAAKPRIKAPYALRLIYISRSGGLVTKMEYLDEASRVLRRYSVVKIEGAEAKARPIEATMEDMTRGGATSLKILSLTTPGAIPDRVFNPGAL